MQPPEEARRRLDLELVRRGFAPSRAAARAAIEAGQVRIDGVVAQKAGQTAAVDAEIEFVAAHPWVSRGGVKLAHALATFNLSAEGLACLDVGASTGGFTDVLLAHGARRVTAVDVGRNQLHPRILSDPRVTSYEATDARSLTAALLGEPPEMIVCDASFISLAKLLGPALELAANGAVLIGLFKPQFEVGRAFVGKGGIVSDLAATDRAASALTAWLTDRGWSVRGWTPSPIRGGDGNEERLFAATRAD